MTGYCSEIGWPQRRHRPRSSSHDTSGMLSRHSMRCPQLGQVDGGWNRERCFLSSLARRRMQTFRKLPKQSPRSAAPTSRSGSATTSHLEEEDARRDRDVQRFGALCERDRHALRRDGVELRPDAGALVADDDRDRTRAPSRSRFTQRSEEHTSELQSPCNLVCRLLLEKKKQ